MGGADALKRFHFKGKTAQEQGIGWGESLGAGSAGVRGGGRGKKISLQRKDYAGPRNML